MDFGGHGGANIRPAARVWNTLFYLARWVISLYLPEWKFLCDRRVFTNIQDRRVQPELWDRRVFSETHDHRVHAGLNTLSIGWSYLFILWYVLSCILFFFTYAAILSCVCVFLRPYTKICAILHPVFMTYAIILFYVYIGLWQRILCAYIKLCDIVHVALVIMLYSILCIIEIGPEGPNRAVRPEGLHWDTWPEGPFRAIAMRGLLFVYVVFWGTH